MRVSPDSQTIEPEDLGTRVLEAAGTLVGRHPELAEFVEGGVSAIVFDTSRRVHIIDDYGALLNGLKTKGSPTMLARAATDNYKELAKYMSWVSVLSKRLAQVMGLSPDEIETIIQGALIHDIGKIDPEIRRCVDIPDRITQDQKDVVAWHPELGARIAEIFGLHPEIVAIIRDHHKRFDGSGYALQNGDRIKIPPSIVGLADSLDVMVRGRPGKPPLTFKGILADVEKNNGSHFHPDAANAFLRNPEAILRSTPVLGMMPS